MPHQHGQTEHPSQHAEQVLLASVLLRPVQIAECLVEVAMEDFYFPIHAEIWRAMTVLHAENAPIDPITLAPRLSEAVPKDYLADLFGSMVDSNGGVWYAKMVREARRRRDLMAIGNHLAFQSTSVDVDRTAAAIAADTVPKLEALIAGSAAGRAKSRRDVLAALADQMTRPLVTYSTGLPTLDDRMIGGLHRKRTYGLLALSKTGKTTFAATVSDALAARKVPHAYVAMEMGAEQIELRRAARALRTSAMALMRCYGRMEWAAALGRLAAAPEDGTIYLDMPGATLAEVTAEIEAARVRHNITGWILDGWQLVGGGASNRSTEEHLRKVAQDAADGTRSRNLWCLITGQMNDDGTGHSCRFGLKMACDQLWKLHREPNSDRAWMEMDMSRYTPIGHVGADDNRILILDQAGPFFREENTSPSYSYDDDGENQC